MLVTKENYSIQAHRVILALSSDLIKELNPDYQQRILLPDYSKSVVEAFVELLYSGTLSIDLNDYTNFISLCKEMKVDVPNFRRDTEEQLDKSINDEMEVSESEDGFQRNDLKDFNQQDDSIESLNSQTLREIDLKQKKTDHNAIGQTSSSRTELSPQSSRTCSDPQGKAIQKIPVNSSNFRKGRGKSRYTQAAVFQEAINAVLKDGINCLEASRRYGIPRTTLYKKFKELAKDT